MNIKKITIIVWNIAIILSVIAGMLFVVKSHAEHMNQYAVEHNCVWKYNNMCYPVDSWEAKHLA